MAPPVLVQPNEGKSEETGTSNAPHDQKPQGATGWTKKIKPPSMVLDEDVNGFKKLVKPKAGQGKKRKGKKVTLYLHLKGASR